MHNATAYNHAYGDSGVFCIHGASHPSQIADVASVITSQFVGMSRNLDVVDFEVTLISGLAKGRRARRTDVPWCSL